MKNIKYILKYYVLGEAKNERRLVIRARVLRFPIFRIYFILPKKCTPLTVARSLAFTRVNAIHINFRIYRSARFSNNRPVILRKRALLGGRTRAHLYGRTLLKTSSHMHRRQVFTRRCRDSRGRFPERARARL